MRLVSVSVLLFALCWLIFGTSPARALVQATATATSEWQPIFPSSTPVPTRNYTCPTALPGGWGQVTPGVNWSLNCSQCLYTLTPSAATQTPFITWPTATPDPSQPTLTPTPIVDDFNLVFFSNADADVHVTKAYPGNLPYQETLAIAPEHIDRVIGILVETRRIGYQTGNNWDIKSGHGGRGLSGSEAGEMWVFNDSPTWLHPNNGDHPLWEDEIEPILGIGNADWDQEWTQFLAENIDEFMALHMWGATSVGRDESTTIKVWHPDVATEGMLQFLFYRGNYVSVNLEVRLLGYIAFNPGGAPVEPVADYCAAVDPGFAGGGGLDPDLGISLPVIVKGPAECSGLGAAGPVDLPLVGEVSFPGIQICFEPISLGNLNLFGVEISLDYMVYVMGGIMILRWFLRS